MGLFTGNSIRLFLLTLLVALIVVGCASAPIATTAPKTGRVTATVPTAIPFRAGGVAIMVDNANQIRVLGSFTQHTATINQYVFASQADRVFSRDGAGDVFAWSLTTGIRSVTVSPINGAKFLVLTPDQKQVVIVGQDRKLRALNAENSSEISSLTADDNPITIAAANADGSAILLGSQAGTLNLWRPATARGATVNIPFVSGATPIAAAFSPDDRWLAVAFSNNALHIYDSKSGTLISNAPTFGEAVIALCFSPDSKLLAAATRSSINVLGTGDYVPRSQLATPGQAPDRSIAFSPDSRLLAVGGSEQFAFIWSVAESKLLAKLPGHAGGFSWLGWSPTGEMLVTVAYTPGGGTYLWKTTSILAGGDSFQRAVLMKDTERIYNGAWSPNSAYLLLGDDRGTIYELGIPKQGP